jgi:hypothetical protein
MSISALVFIMGTASTLCFALGVNIQIMRQNKNAESLFFGLGWLVLIMLIGGIITMAASNFFRMSEPPSNTIQVTITPEAR